MGTREVKTITLSTQDVELLRMAIDAYRESYRSNKAPEEFEEDQLGRFFRRLAPVMQVTPREFLLLLMNPMHLAHRDWSRSPPKVESTPGKPIDADRDPNIRTIVTALSSLRARLFDEFMAQDLVTVNDEVAATGDQFEEGLRHGPRQGG